MAEDEYGSYKEGFWNYLAHGARETIRTVAEVTIQPAKELNEPIYNFFNENED